MAAPRTTTGFEVRSYEMGPDGRVGAAVFLHWCQEAAYANSFAMGFDLATYDRLGVTWVMRQNDLEILARPLFGDRVDVTSWIAEIGRVTAQREYEARDQRGRLLARCSTQWVMVDQKRLTPTRVPAVMHEAFDPARDFVVEPIEWPEVDGEPHQMPYLVRGFEEDALGHVNNAIYLNWIEESMRQVQAAEGRGEGRARRHFLRYRQPAFRGDQLTIESRSMPWQGGRLWAHEVLRDGTRLLSARSISMEEEEQ